MTGASAAATATLTLSTFTGKRDNRPREVALTWGDFCDRVSKPAVRASKDGPLYGPARFDPAHRAKSNVTELFALALDLDHDVTLAADLTIWRKSRYIYGAHTTHSHKRVTKLSA